jgi:hypothetical protein
VDFAFSEEQELLRASARDYLADRWPATKVVEVADRDPAFDAATWKELADLGWLDTGAEHGLGLLEHAVLAEETAYALLPAPWFSTIALAGPLLDPDLAAAVGAGERAVTVARTGSAAAAGGALTGTFSLVPDLASVTDVVVLSGDAAHVVDLRGRRTAVDDGPHPASRRVAAGRDTCAPPVGVPRRGARGTPSVARPGRV